MLEYKYILIPVITLTVTQIFKFATESIIHKKIDFSRLFNGNGGMPSSHTAFTTSLAFAIGISEGYDSAIFAVALIFSIIVAYDAMGLRMESGKHAMQINLLTENSNLENKVTLKELIGHKPLEVIIGFICGIVSAYIQTGLIFK